MNRIIRALALVLVVSMMAFPAMAAFTPSAEQKGAPEVKETMTDSTGKKVAAVVVDKDGKEIEGVSAKDVKVESYAETVKTAPKEVKEVMEKAFTEISTKPLTEVAPELTKALPEVSKEAGKDVKAENLVVRDLVHVELKPEVAELIKDGAKVAMNFDLQMEKGQTLIVMQLIDGEWVVIYGEDVVINADGTATINLAGAGPVAFVVDSTDTAKK